MECCICLDSFTTHKNNIYTLSCNHKLHYECLLKYIYCNTINIFINCPLCREMNISTIRLYNSSFENLKLFSPLQRCIHMTKQGKRCKNKCHILNYEYCYTHNKDVLPKDKYKLMCDYIYYLLETFSTNRTKLYMIDSGKKLCIKYPELKDVQSILHYYFRFYSYNKKMKVLEDWAEIYDYYDISHPPKDWIHKCLENKSFA